MPIIYAIHALLALEVDSMNYTHIASDISPMRGLTHSKYRGDHVECGFIQHVVAQGSTAALAGWIDAGHQPHLSIT